jgi:hypothetical protein
MSYLRRAFPVVLTLLLAAAAQAVEPGSPLAIQPPSRPRPVLSPPTPRPVELARFLESPGREEASVRLWLRFNREAHGIAQGTRDFLDTLRRLTARLPKDVLLTHEHVLLDASSGGPVWSCAPSASSCSWSWPASSGARWSSCPGSRAPRKVDFQAGEARVAAASSIPAR